MGNRPTDWNAIGLSTDPTPGDPVRLRALVDSMDSLGRVAREIDSGLNSVLDKTGKGAFVGQTADALRDRISGPLREFVQSIADAFENSAKSMRTYVDVMETQQRIADTALANGRGLTAEDPNRAQYGTTARDAGTAQRTQAQTTAKVVNTAAAGIKQPVTDCELFWEAFNWLAILLILPALLLGGPLALLAIGVNLVLFVKTAVDFSQGKAGLLDLFLSGLGMIAPTTKGINLLKLFKDGAKFVWNGFAKFGQSAWKFVKGTFNAGAFRSFAFIPAIKDFARLAGNWIKVGGLWVGAAALKMPSWIRSTLGKGGLAVVNGFKAIPALFRGIPGALKGFAGSTWTFAKNQLGGTKWLRLILPVDAAEISRFGLKRALQIGFYERGVLGKFRYGAPLLSAGGRGLSQIPTPPLHGVNALTDMPVADLARIRIGDWAGPGPGGINLKSLAPPTNLTVTSPGGLHIPTSFGEVMQFAPDAVRRMDALLDIGARDLRMVQIGDWAKLPTPAGSGRMELTGVGSIGQLAPTNAAAGAVHALPTPGTLPAVTHTPSLTSLSALDLVQNGATHRPNTPSLLTGGGPGGTTTGVGHLANPNLTTPTLNGPALTNPGLTGGHGLTAPGVHPQVQLKPVEFGATSGVSTPSPATLAGGPQPTAPMPDHVGSALNLLDHGPSTPIRVLDSPANAGAPPPPHAPGSAGRPVSGPPTSSPLAVAPAPPPPGAGLVGPGNRLAPGRLEQLWQRDADRIGALFGAADDPLRTSRVEAWRDLASARNELGRAQQVLHDLEIRPGGGSKPSAFERDARLAVDHASTKVETALTRLDRLGVDPARVDKGIAQVQAQSLLERPRLVGGNPYGPHNGMGDLPTTSATGVSHTPTTPVAGGLAQPTPDIPLHVGPGTNGLDGLSIRTGFDEAGNPRHSLVGADGGPPGTGPVLEVRGSSGFAVRHPDGTVHGFGPAGEPLTTHVPLRGQPSGLTLLTEYHGSGPTTHTLVDTRGTRVTESLVTSDAHGFRVTDPTTGSSTRYRVDGSVLDRGTALAGPGNPRFVVTDGTTHRLTDVLGRPFPDHAVTGVDGHGFRVTDTTTGGTARYNARGVLVESGTALDGPRGAHFLVENGTENLRLTDVHGRPIPDHTLTSVDHGNGLRVTDTSGNTSTRYSRDGSIEHSTRLGGNDTHFVVDHGNGRPTLTDLDGRPIPNREVTAIQDGYRVTDPTTNTSTRYNSTDGSIEHSTRLGGNDTHFVVDHGNGRLTLTDLDGRPIPNREVTAIQDGYRVTDPTTNTSTRYNTTDGSIEHGTPLRAGADETHFVVDAGNGRLTLTDTHGTLVPGREVTAVQGGYRVTDNVGGASVRYTADGAVAERGIALGGAGDPRFVVAEGTGHRLTDTHGVLRPEVVQTHPGGGYRVEPQPGGARTYERFDAGGNPVGSGQELFDAAGTRIGYVDRPTAGPALMLDNAFDPGSARSATSTPDGIRVDDAHGGHRVFDNNSGALTHETIVLRDPSAAAPTARVTVDHATGAAPTVHLVEAPGVPGPARTVTRDPVTGELRVTINEPNSPRHGEFRTHSNDGSLGHEGFNVLRDGRRTDHQYVVDHHARTWRQEYRDGVTPPADVNKPAGFERNGFERGTVDASGAANGGIKLKSATPGKVDVFERRLLPGGNTLDAFRRTDLSGFGSTSRRTTWVEYGVDGAVANSGTRRFDTSGFGWQDVDSGGSVVRESRDTLQKFDGKAGHTLGIEGDTGWTWHRYDATGNELAHGPRTPHADGGWSDRTIARPDAHGNTPARGDLVQKQWGPLHSPNNARHYVEHPLARPTDPAHTTWDVQPSWDKQSPQGKESGKHEVKADGSTFTTNRVSEQRPPQWARRMLGDGGTQPTGIHAFLGPDTRYQMFAWEKTTPNPAGGEPLSHSGARFVGDDGGYVDIHADGTFARSQTKLHSGSTLKVGDTVAPHPNAPAGSVPWNDGGTTGYRIETPGGAPGDAVWQDIRFAADGTDPRVVREGFANGNVREYNAPQPHHDPAGNPVADPNANWVQRDGHGYPTGQRHTWPTADGTGQVTVTAAGKPTARTWDWQAVDSNGNVTEGKRVLFRGSDDPKLPFDDSFRDFDARNNLVRERRMLDGGKYVDAWRTETDGWKWQKFGRNGAETPHPRATGQTGEQVRTWWNPEGGANGRWEPHPTDHKNLLFRDEYRPSTGANVVVRETPPHIGDSAPARVREYHPGGDTTPAPGTWKEFDHGSAVRTREQMPDGTYLETDAWRGQWRHYSAGDHLLGRRTDGGVVITTDSLGRWQAIGTEYDFRGPLSELRGWGRRIREGQRMPWTDGRQGIDATRFRGALQGLPNIPATGAIRLAEAAYQPYWSVIAKKALLEFGQEFVIEFAANLIANGINAAINNKPFTGKDVLKSFANAAVGSAVKTTLGTFIHENRLTHTRWMGDTKSGLGNIDGGKHWSRRPGNHDKTWANEWAGNETPIRWRSGTYDFGFNVGLGGITGWVNGAMNASVWGITGADGLNHKLTGWDAFLDGGLSAFSGMLSNGSVALARNVALSGAGGRLFHRQGFNEFVLNIAFKSLEKVFSGWLTPTLRGAIHPYWY